MEKMERRALLPIRRPPNKRAFAYLIMIACAVGAALLAAMAAPQDSSAQGAPDPAAGWFQRCSLAKTGYFDPIVYPGTPPRVGHRHLFFGSTAISYDTTSPSDLQAGEATCRFEAGTVEPPDGGKLSSYW